MRKLYNEFFYIPKHGKIREKVMLTRLISTITIVIVCLAAMSITAYAYFSYNITSGSNTIKAASFYTDVTVQITDADGNAVENSNITPITSDNRKFRIEGLEVGKWYQFTITKNEVRNTAQTGFIIVSAEGCPVTYHTQQLGVDKSVPGEYTPAIIFKLMITDATDVILESHWGTSSCYSEYQIGSVDDERYIILNEEIKMIVNGHTKPNVSTGTDEGSDDESKETGSTTPSTNTTTGTETPSTQTSESTTTPSTETSTPVETTPPETTGESESTNTTEPSSTTTEPATQTTEPASTETTAETQPATETTETTGAPTTEASE